ncbi:transposase [uncultured Chryseobacterium sp.]|uniref:transposase n=1 Tax=uncultured Chryseobacterium sp. TaxID=259322 RepID=UPI003747DCC4
MANLTDQMNFKEIHIGSMIKQRMLECGIEMTRACNFLKCTEETILLQLESETLDSGIILRWSKLLEYDFFRIYSQHLILYAPSGANHNKDKKQNASTELLPKFRKNIYTKEIIEFFIDLIQSGEKSKQQIINEYKIPKTTLYKWLEKYKK